MIDLNITAPEDFTQGSEEWLQARTGKITASKMYAVMAKTKTGTSAEREKYKYEIISEILTSMRKEVYITQEMQWGLDNEEKARKMYEEKTGNIVTTCGFIMHPELELSGASPDGLVLTDGTIEIKCPSTYKHIKTLQTGEVDGAYIYQMQWAMACTKRDYCDFITFDPRLPSPLSIKIIRIDRDDELIAAMEQEVRIMQDEIKSIIETVIAGTNVLVDMQKSWGNI